MENKNIGKLIFLFLISYVILFLLSVFNSISGFGGWAVTADLSKIDYFYVLAPISGFFFMFFLVSWAEKYFETKFLRNPLFGVLFLFLSVVAYYVSLFWFYCNLFSLAQTSVCSSEGSAQTTNYLSSLVPNNNLIANFFSDLPIDFIGGFFNSILRTQFMSLFLSGPYIIFILAALFGWVSRLILFKLEEENSGKL